MSAPLGLVLEPATRARSSWPWAFLAHFGLGLWYGAGLWLLATDSTFLRPWVSATAIAGAWWMVWRGLVALLEAR